jgi:hypothetical protein
LSIKLTSEKLLKKYISLNASTKNTSEIQKSGSMFFGKSFSEWGSEKLLKKF